MAMLVYQRVSFFLWVGVGRMGIIFGDHLSRASAAFHGWRRPSARFVPCGACAVSRCCDISRDLAIAIAIGVP